MVLKIGPIAIDPPVVLAPMAGVTNVPFRRLCRSYGAALYVSEMVSARAVIENNAKTTDMMRFGDDEPIRSLQLYGVDPRVVGRAVTMAVENAGVDHIDLNFGCPAQKVNKVGGGAALPVHVTLFSHIVSAAVRAAGSIPVTVKMRKGIDDQTLTYLEAGRAAQDAGAAAVALHARTAEQLYSGRADWPAIQRLREVVTSVPVLGNGDVWAATDALDMMDQTGCAGVVVGRGCLGRPWLFRELTRVVEHKDSELFGVRGFRKHIGWYLTGYPAGAQPRRDLMGVDTIADVEHILDGLDHSAALPENARNLPRGHLHGPRPVELPAGWLESAADPTPPTGADSAFSGG
jgi:nifR3 family TIM-barrel protein